MATLNLSVIFVLLHYIIADKIKIVVSFNDC